MRLTNDVLELARDPHEFMHRRLGAPPNWRDLAVTTIAPLIAIRPAAVLLRSVVQDRPMAGMVLGTSSLVLQLVCWIALAVALPALVRQFQGELSEKRAFVLATYVSIPLWLAGCLYLAPEEPAWLLVVSRAAVAIAASWGLYVLYVGLEEADIDSRQLIVIVGVVAGAYVALYLMLFALLGVSSHVVLFMLTR